MSRSVEIIQISVAFVLSVFALTVPVHAADIYVSVDSGSDITGDGSTSSPYATIKHVLDSVAVSGDDIRVDQGTYSDSLTLTDGVGIYGGYDSTSAWSPTNDPALTIIKGCGFTVKPAKLTSPAPARIGPRIEPSRQ